MENDSPKNFVFEFADEGPRDLSYEVSTDGKEQLVLEVHGEKKMLFGNRDGLLALAKICIKLAEGNYPRGFHLHIDQNFDEQLEETMTVALTAPKNTKTCQA